MSAVCWRQLLVSEGPEVHVIGRSGLPLVVCVSPDREVREYVVSRLDDLGAVLICADLSELRSMLSQVEADALDTTVNFGDLVLDAVQHEVAWRGRALDLTRLEHRLLTRLASPPVSVWPYDRLFSTVWDSAYLGDSSILHSAVKRLRQKLRALDGGPVIETVRGIGYRLRHTVTTA